MLYMISCTKDSVQQGEMSVVINLGELLPTASLQNVWGHSFEERDLQPEFNIKIQLL